MNLKLIKTILNEEILGYVETTDIPKETIEIVYPLKVSYIKDGHYSIFKLEKYNNFIDADSISIDIKNVVLLEEANINLEKIHYYTFLQNVNTLDSIFNDYLKDFSDKIETVYNKNDKMTKTKDLKYIEPLSSTVH